MDLSSIKISELEATFQKNNVDSINISILKDTTTKTGMMCQASIRFSNPNGMTSGRHAIGFYDDPARVIKELQDFISSLK